MDAIFAPVAAATGASLDQLKLIACLLISYPLGSVFIRIPSSQLNLKHLFNIGVAVFYLVAMLNLWSGLLQLLASALATYVIAATVQGPNMPWIVFVLVMGHLTANHIIRAVFELGYETIEITGPQMVLTMKLTTYAWNVWDGRRPVEDLDKWQQAKRITKTPSIVAFLGYVFYFPGLLVGPYLDFADYTSLIDGSLFKITDKADEKVVEANTVVGRVVPKGRKRVAYWKMLIGLGFLGCFVVFGGSYNYHTTGEKWWLEQNLLMKILTFQLFGVVERTKYYALWILTEGAAILTGLGFTGYSPSGSTKWEGAANVDVMNIEFAPNFKVLLDSWNMKTNVWLRECVYKRVTPKGKKPGFRSSMLTFATSAFWHGIATGYYLTFLFGGFVQTSGRLCRSYLRPLVLPASYIAARNSPPPPQTLLKQLYDLVGTICTTLLLNFTAAPFMLLTIRGSFKAWGSMSWYGVWMVGAAMAFFYLGGSRSLGRVQKKRVEKAGGHVTGVKKPSPAEPVTPGTAQVLPPLDSVIQNIENADFSANLQK